MSISVGQIGLDLVLNKKSFNKQLNGVSNSVNQASNKISASFKKIGTAVAAAFSVKVIANFGKECIDLGSDLAEVQNVVDVTFSKMSEKVNSWAKNASDTYGLSETMAKKYVGLYGTMSRQFGFTEQEAYKMSTTLAGLAGDVASYYNITQDEAYTKLKAVYSGETEVLKDIGIVMTQSALDSYALANGYGKTTSKMTEAEKVSLRYNFILSQLNSTTGDFVRTQNNWANQTRILQLRFDSLKATVGQGLINAFTPAIKVINTILEKLTVVTEKFKEFTEQIFGNAGSSAGSMAGAAESAALLTEEAEGSSSALADTAKNAEKTKRSLAGFDKLNVITSSGESGEESNASSVAATPVTAAVTVDEEKTKKSIQGAFSNLYENSGLGGFFSKVQHGIDSVNWGKIGENCQLIFKKIQPIAERAFIGVQKVGKSAFSALGSYIGGTIIVVGKSIETVSGGINQWLEKDKKKIQDAIDTISTNFSKGFDNLSTFFEKWFGLIGESIDRMRSIMENALSFMLSGYTNFAISVGTIVSEGFAIATGSLVAWIEKDGAEIGLFFDNIQQQIADVMTFIGTIFNDIGTILSEWWNSEGAAIFQNVCDMFLYIGTTLMNVYNDYIMPAWDFIVGVFQSAWDNCLKPIFEKLISFIGKVCNCIATLWNNFLSPIVNYIVDTLKPVFVNAFNAVKGVFDTLFTVVGDVIGGILDSLGGLLDFITGIFSGNWEKAWQGICDYSDGIWESIWGVIKGFVNLIIDGINKLWTGIYTAVQGIVNSIGSVAGALGDLFGQDWHFSMPSEPPLIPKLANGGLVKAPTLALVGDNAGANTGDPEVVSPLSKLQGMIDNSSNGYDTAILEQMLEYLKKLYELFLLFKNNGSGIYEFVAKINGSELFSEMIRQDELWKKRHNGKSAFAYLKG